MKREATSCEWLSCCHIKLQRRSRGTLRCVLANEASLSIIHVKYRDEETEAVDGEMLEVGGQLVARINGPVR